MDFEVDRNTSGTGDPSLAEMTMKALRILKKNTKGYFLFVEGIYNNKSKININKNSLRFIQMNL